jgi:hypothetical protein
MPETKWQWVLLLALAAVAPFVYASIQAYWALLLAPAVQLFSVSGKAPLAIAMVMMNLLGAFIVATIVSAPLGYVMRDKPYLFGALLSLAPLLFLLWLLFEDGWNAPGLLGVVRIAEYLSTVIAFVAMARLGAHLRTVKEGIA